jgi:HK97 family phage prohead protease
MRFSGYASLFGEVDLGKDAIEAGAFLKSVQTRGAAGIRMLWQHDPNQPIGTWTEVREDKRGLYVEGKLAKGVAKATEVLELMRSGAIDGLSIGFKTIKAKADTAGIRHIHEADLWEISVVTFPMLPSARVGQVKSLPADAMPDKDYSNQHRLLWNIKANEVLIEALKRSPQSEYNCRWLARLKEENAELKSHSTLYEPFQIWYRKYNPDQPRVSAGNPDGGQWTDGGGGSASGTPLSQEAFDRRWGAGKEKPESTASSTATAAKTPAQPAVSAAPPARDYTLRKLGKEAMAGTARNAVRSALGTAGFYFAMTSPAGGAEIDQTFNAPDGSSVRVTGYSDSFSRDVAIDTPGGDAVTFKLSPGASGTLELDHGTINGEPMDTNVLEGAVATMHAGGMNNVVLSEGRKNPDHKYYPKPKSAGEITGIPGLEDVKAKGIRKRFKDKEGNIYEWDRQHGTLEKYDKKGKHLGEYDPKTGQRTPGKKGKAKPRTTEP